MNSIVVKVHMEGEVRTVYKAECSTEDLHDSANSYYGHAEIWALSACMHANKKFEKMVIEDRDGNVIIETDALRKTWIDKRGKLRAKW
ncbi:hypothetical protein C3473_24720 [Mycobacterium kansasii]|uniref:hypothetical protein n=1 Tax=Mycobacterium kansasii TaxID=1768 RepID=UPI000CDE2469|nr:hypothetical protein [Mycobacterium kansasii]POX90190.1 hypothetical protein C3473_24720 [Mycobacterium kansasii]